MIIVIGLGIMWQIPRQDDAMPTDQGDHVHAPAQPVGAGGEGGAPPASADAAGPYRIIALEVSGMT